MTTKWIRLDYFCNTRRPLSTVQYHQLSSGLCNPRIIHRIITAINLAYQQSCQDTSFIANFQIYLRRISCWYTIADDAEHICNVNARCAAKANWCLTAAVGLRLRVKVSEQYARGRSSLLRTISPQINRTAGTTPHNVPVNTDKDTWKFQYTCKNKPQKVCVLTKQSGKKLKRRTSQHKFYRQNTAVLQDRFRPAAFSMKRSATNTLEPIQRSKYNYARVWIFRKKWSFSRCG